MLHHRWERKVDGQHPLKMFTFLLIAAVGLVGKQVCPADAASPYRATFETLASGSDSPAQRYFDAVAPEDRENFIKYHLDKALELRVPGYRSGTPKDFDLPTFQDTMEPEDFSINLLDHFMATFGVTELHVYEFVALNIICFPSGLCFNPDDVGNICCPF